MSTFGQNILYMKGFLVHSVREVSTPFGMQLMTNISHTCWGSITVSRKEILARSSFWTVICVSGERDSGSHRI